MKYYITKADEMVGPLEMEKPNKESGLNFLEQMRYITSWEKYCAAAPKHLHRLPNKVGDIVEEGKDFEWRWFVKTESYQGDGGGIFYTEKEANDKYYEWSKWNGNLQAFTHEPVRVAIPKEEKQESFTREDIEGLLLYAIKNNYRLICGDFWFNEMDECVKFDELLTEYLTNKSRNNDKL